MKSNRTSFILGLGAVALLSGILGGVNLHWSRSAEFPLYGYIIDVCAVPVLIFMIMYARRLKAASTDEFALTKRRFAAQTGFVIGFALFAVTGLFPLVLPDLYRAFIASLDGAGEGFIMGRVSGMAPFVIGLVIGQVAAWKKYA